ncbi:MAG TPA: hypothetical protein VFY21_04165 [Xanthobacteraceae bacterium]|nr:hypothetical protein [Xanthobacteraceae bacterium]
MFAGSVLVAALIFGTPAAAQSGGENYARVRAAYEAEASAYWRQIGEKRRLRAEKRRRGETLTLNDYVLVQPPVYSGPLRPPGPPLPSEPRRPDMPVVADFLKHAAEEFGFVPRRPVNELEYKRAYARAALDAGLTREQAVGIYAFETGGNGNYDTQAGLIGKGTRAISPALGYNQLLSTNTVGLLAEHGETLIALLSKKAAALSGPPKAAMLGKIDALERMVAFSRTVPNRWSEHDKLAKTTRGGMGIHAAVLDLDLGPWLQARKLMTSLHFARARGHKATLSAAELELMNFTGDGNGIDMVSMPPALRERVPTANFFQQEGYERNPIARRTEVVAALIADIAARAERGRRQPGAQDLDAAFVDVGR